MILRYVGKRFLHAVPVVFGVSLIAFLLIHLVPGDPVRIALGPKASLQAVQRARHDLGLDRSLLSQYGHFAASVFRGDLGYSIQEHTSVGSLVWPRVGPSVFLLIYATVISVVLAVPLGIASALRRDRFADHTVRLVTMVTFAMPSFWLALVLVELLSLRLHVFPVSGYSGGVGEKLRDLTLPAFTIGLFLAPMLIRTLRGSIIDVLVSDYVEAARARGLAERRVIVRHVLRNASIATLTVLAVNIGFLISGTVVVEVVFDLPGLGTLAVNSIQTRDYPTVQAITLVFSVMVVIVNLVTDLLLPVIDPRVRSAA